MGNSISTMGCFWSRRGPQNTRVYPQTPNLGCFRTTPTRDPLLTDLETFWVSKHLGDQLLEPLRGPDTQRGHLAQTTQPCRGKQSLPQNSSPQIPDLRLSSSLPIPKKCSFFRNKTLKAEAHTQSCAHTHSHAYPHAHTHMHTCTPTCTHTYTHTLICTHIIRSSLKISKKKKSNEPRKPKFNYIVLN